MELAGKTAVITGGASGIGLATARRLLELGANVVLGDIEPDALAEAVGELGERCVGRAVDVAKEDDVLALRELAIDTFGAAHIVFNNAGVGGGPTIGTPKAVWDWVMGVNVDGVVNGLNAFVPYFLERGEGWVVNTASLAGLGGVPGMGAYCASKFAVVGISESLYHELATANRGVGVSVLCPGFVSTRIFESQRNMPDELRDYNDAPGVRAVNRIAEKVVKAGIDPREVANAVADAITHEHFWILTHERTALKTTQLRLEWMRGGPPPGIDLERATKS
ncbi:MAG: SDR family NAD(P)-dependent oxidoreductase [Acidobacteriota bacterium]|nr:SDR family NAD(P)-dependent oxidoreductase [Acidobacteriota bacterium]